MSQGLCFNKISFSKTGSEYLINLIQKHPLLEYPIICFLYFGQVLKINKTGKGRQNKEGGNSQKASNTDTVSQKENHLLVQRTT